MNEKLKILFLCTGNSCRSQMAEGWARHLKSDVINAYSAGVEPAEFVNTWAIAVMAEAGVDISGHRPKHIDELKGIDFDYVVTVCDHAREICPIYTGNVKIIHHCYADPSFMECSVEEKMTAFRVLRDEIKEVFVLL